MLCSGCRTIYWLHSNTYIYYIYMNINNRLYWRFYLFLYYLYCLSIFQRTSCFRFKSGCKGKGFIFNYQTFSEFFLFFSFYSFLRLSMRKGKNAQKKKKGRFLCESDCKDKNFIYYPPKLFGSFFVLFFKHNFAFSLCQFCKAFFSWKAGAKVRPFSIQSKYIKLFFLSFFERIC